MKTLVVFLGNEIAGDDSIGYEIYRKIKISNKVFLSTDFFKLYGIYKNQERLIIVDAVYGINEIIHLKNDEIFEIDDKSIGNHFISAIEALKILKIVMKNFPKEIHLIGLPAKDFNKITYNDEIIEKAIRKIEEIMKKS